MFRQRGRSSKGGAVTLLKIDKRVAESVMRAQAELSERDPGDEAWIDRVKELSRLCEVSRMRTHIAFFGTAVLAKAVDTQADLKWIKPKHAVNAPHAFSARTLSEKVLVPVAADLGIHLGVTSPQPLNNQPYFRMTYLGDDTPINAANRTAFDYMRDIIAELEKLDEDGSLAALRSFISVRKEFQPRYAEAESDLNVSPKSLADAIVTFVADGSEGGKRAQACVAGLFDASFGSQNVASGRINDPSRNTPGDVCVVCDGTPFKAIEVKDKPVTFNDVQIFAKKAVDMGVTDAAYVLVAQRQETLDEDALQDWARSFGLTLMLFYDWRELISHSLYWSPLTMKSASAFAAERIKERLIGIEVHPQSLKTWFDLIGLAPDKKDSVRA